MTKRIQPSEATFRPIRDSGPALPRIDADRIQEALGAEAAAERLKEALAPVTLFALREELVKRLQSSGGRPALAGVTRRAKVPLSDKEWLQLEELAAAISSPGFAPSAGQVASVLLTQSLHAVALRLSQSTADPSRSPLVRELAALAAAESSREP
ncbi:MAG TPA: hypothetical protein VH682_23815 [Gemmataceae bacterium]|jgi:hypothetical protein